MSQFCSCSAAGRAAVNGMTQEAAKVVTDGRETIWARGMVSMTVEDAEMTAMMIMNQEIASAAAKADTGHRPYAGQRMLVLARASVMLHVRRHVVLTGPHKRWPCQACSKFADP